MKRVKSIFVWFLVLVTVFALCACQPQPEPPEVTETDIDLVKGGASDYKIVKPESCGETVSFAAEELQRLFRQATQCELPVVTDSGLTFRENEKVLSLGKTTLFSEAGLTAEERELNTDGFKLITKGQTVFMAGGNDDGTLYAAYEFLTRTLNYRYYAANEITCDAKADVKLLNFNITDIPDFAHRNVYFKSIKDNADVRGMFRSHNNDAWGLFAHSYFTLVPPDEYQEKHPDWYYPREGTPKQLCLTSEGLAEVLTENLKAYIIKKPDAHYFMVGQEDFNTWCDCENCRESGAKYGGASGTMMRFINKVAKSIAEWQKETCPERDIWVCTFAYQRTKAAPAVHNDDGTYAPADPSVVAEPNVMVQYAPLDACYAHSFNEDCNASVSTAIEGWKSVSKNFAIWSYCTNFTNYLMNFNNFSSLKADYQIYKDMGAHVMMDQGTGETIASPFHDLRVYLQSQLMWRVDQDVNALVDNFMRAYYQDVYSEMSEYYRLMRLHYASLDADMRLDGEKFDSYVYNTINFNNEQSQFWPKTFLDQCMNLFQEAFGVIDGMQDSVVKEKLRIRVLSETLSTRYLLIQLQSGFYSKAEINEMIDLFEQDARDCGLVCWKENTPLGEKLAEWRATYR